MTELIWTDATTLARRIRERDLSVVELMHAYYDQIERVNPGLNAIVNLLERERAVALALDADRQLARGTAAGPLFGLPMAPKDLFDAAGFATTEGFVPFAGKVAETDAPIVARQRAAGALFIGKTNTPEFGLGSHTFNRLFGATRNPFDPGRTAGGSSGGAAAALAAGMLPLADGSDMGGSLRNPASFCGVVGLRPSIGRVPVQSNMGWLARLSTPGPMARTVADTALLLSVQAGPFAPDPLTLPEAGAEFRADLRCDPRGLKIAFTPDLGLTPVEPQVAAACRNAASVFEQLGCSVVDDCPDLDGAMDVFQTQRAAQLALLGHRLDGAVANWREHAKDTALWNIDRGLQLSSEELLAAEVKRTALYARVAQFFERYDALLLPAAQVAPFDVNLDWVHEINGQPMATYLDWMTVCCAISITGLPALSVPCGYTLDGLPIGLQIVGKPRGDFALLKIAYAFEQATQSERRRPELNRIPANAP